jgi:trk system potassium uptake protein TrkA
MFVIVAGCGRLGAGLAKVLSAQGKDVVVVAESIDQKRLGNDFDGVTVSGSPIDEDVLKKAGIEKAQLFVAATADDNLNIMAIQIAKEVFHVPMVLARVSDGEREKFYKGMGLSTVCPTTTGINQILGLIQKSLFAPLAGYIDPDLVGVRPLPEWVGRPAGKIDLGDERRLVGVVRRDGSPDIDQGRPIEKDDTLILLRNHRG